MSGFCGTEFLVKRGNGDGPPETFTTVGGMQSTAMTLNKEQVDVTNKDDAPWRQLLAGCGIKTMSITLSGVVVDDTALKALQADFFSATAHSNFQLVSGLTDEFEGAFEIASFERTGEYNGAETYSMTLESAGDITYTAPT